MFGVGTYVLDDPWFGSRQRREFSLHPKFQTGSGPHPPSYSVGAVVLSRADHLSPSSAGVKKEQGCTVSSPVCRRGLDRENVMFYKASNTRMISKKGIGHFKTHFPILPEIRMSLAVYSAIHAIIQCNCTTLPLQLSGKSRNFCTYL